jgi:hypothetical protein
MTDTGPGAPGRRAFLRGAGAVTGLAALSSVTLSACSRAASRPGNAAATASTGARASASASAADWAALAKDLSGPLVRPGASSYLDDLQLFDPRFDGIRPAWPSPAGTACRSRPAAAATATRAGRPPPAWSWT